MFLCEWRKLDSFCNLLRFLSEGRKQYPDRMYHETVSVHLGMFCKLYFVLRSQAVFVVSLLLGFFFFLAVLSVYTLSKLIFDSSELPCFKHVFFFFLSGYPQLCSGFGV